MKHLMVEEDIEVAHAALISLLGKDGRILPRGKDVWPDITIYSPESGKLWYGDMYKHETTEVIAVLKAFNIQSPTFEVSA